MPRTTEQILAKIDERTEWLVKTGEQMLAWQVRQDEMLSSHGREIERVETKIDSRAILWGAIAGTVPVLMAVLAYLTQR